MNSPVLPLAPHVDFSHVSTGTSFAPEDNPYQTVLVEVTHACNMECKNCYIPNRDIPDMDIEWMFDAISRFPNRTRVRLTGGEATMRKDLDQIIRRVRDLGHLPILMTNGLKLGNAAYAKRLRNAGLRSLYISMNGGLSDDLYWELDEMRCAKRKIEAFETACAANFYVIVGMIVVPGVNDDHVNEFYRYVSKQRVVREFHLRNVGAMGRYMEGERMSMDDLVRISMEMTGLSEDFIRSHQKQGSNYIDFPHNQISIQLTDWPDLDNGYRGRLTPDGRVEPFMEHTIANSGGY